MPFPKKQKIYFQCEQCGKVITTYPYKKGKARFCSNKCKYLYIKMKMFKKHAMKQKLRVPIVCQNIFCNKVFWVVPSAVSKRKYCSRKCQYQTLTPEYQEELKYREELQQRKEEIKRMIFLNK